MAILYKANETDFSHLGLGPLNDAISILVTEERNGIFELEMKYPVSGKLFKELKNDRIIKADAGHKLKDQRFKIIRITKPLDGIVTVYAEHVSYLTQDLALKPKVTFTGNARQALEHWKANLVDDDPFTVWSDISTTGKINWSIDEVENARRALGGVQGSILDVYGGEYLFDNYDIYLYQKRGVNSELLIAYGRNLVDLEQEEEIANTYTSIYPYSIYTDDDGNERMVTLPEYYIDSEHVDKYARRKILVVDFTNDEIKTVSALRDAARRYIIDNDVGVPRVNLKIKYIDLAKTLDYKDLALYEEVNLCDNVMIYFEKYGINTTAKVIKVVWDALNERYDSIEVGEARASLSQAIDTVVDGKVHNVEKLAMQTLRTADGKNTIYFGLEEPLATEYDLKKNDIWYRIVDGEFTRTYRYDGAVWQLIIDMDSQQAKIEAQQAKDEAQSAVNRANQATQQATDAINQAQTAFDEAQQALSTASNAYDIATTLQGDVVNLSTLVDDHTGQISSITQSVTGLQTQVSDIEGNVSTLTQTVSGLTTRVGDAEGNITALQQTSVSLAARLSDAEGNITTLTATVSGLQTTVSNIEGDVSSVTQLANALQVRMTNAEGDISTLTQTASSLQSTITEVRDSVGRWTKIYRVRTANPLNLTESDGSSLNDSYTYEVSAKVRNTSTQTTAVAIFKANSSGGSGGAGWTLEIIYEQGKTSNHPEFFIDGNGRPSVRLYNHTSYYDVEVIHEKTIGRESVSTRTQSQITQLSDAINLRVQKGDVINQINISTESILIDGRKVHITGQTTIDDAAIKSAHIESLDGGKITAGSIDAGKLNVTELSAISAYLGTVISGRIETLEIAGGSTPSIYFESRDNPRGTISYAQDSMRFMRDSWTYYRVNRGGSTGSSGVDPKFLHQFYAADEAIFNFGIVGSHTTLTSKNALLKFSSITNLVQVRDNYDNSFADLQADKLITNQLHSNEIRGTSGNLYLRPAAGGSIQAVTATGVYIPITASSVIANSVFTQNVEARNQDDVYVRPTNSGGLYVRSRGSGTPYRPVYASAFNQSSSRDYKTNIEKYNESALEVINDLTVVTYNLKDDLENGIIDKKIGFISEDSKAIATADGKAIQTYQLSAYNTKAIQELDLKFTNLEDEVNWLEIENQYLKQKVKQLEEMIA